MLVTSLSLWLLAAAPSSLEWQSCLYGQQIQQAAALDGCSGEPTPLQWREVQQIVQQHATKGNGWRLPTISELKQLERRPAATGHLFSAQVMRHGNDLLLATYRLSDGKIEYQPLQVSGLLLLIRDRSP